MSVFVRWYGSILQGEVVGNQEKGILSGMVAVRIQVQGMKATALFSPEHVYASAEEIKGNSPKISSNSPKVSKNPRKISRNENFEQCQERINEALMKADPLDFLEVEAPESVMNVLRFKQENWDHEHNHLRIDKLDEFYEMWKAACAPIFKPLMVEGNPEELAEAFENYNGVIYILDEASVTLPSHKPQPIVSDKRMAELKAQLKKSLKPVEATQLTLFD